MAIIKELSDFHEYFSGVMRRANSHALNVNQVLPLLVGVVLTHVDMVSGLQVRTYQGHYANVTWIKMGNNRYAFSYDGDDGCVLLKENTVRGIELARFDNSDTYSSVVTKIKKVVV